MTRQVFISFETNDNEQLVRCLTRLRAHLYERYRKDIEYHVTYGALDAGIEVEQQLLQRMEDSDAILCVITGAYGMQGDRNPEERWWCKWELEHFVEAEKLILKVNAFHGNSDIPDNEPFNVLRGLPSVLTVKPGARASLFGDRRHLEQLNDDDFKETAEELHKAVLAAFKERDKYARDDPSSREDRAEPRGLVQGLQLMSVDGRWTFARNEVLRRFSGRTP